MSQLYFMSPNLDKTKLVVRDLVGMGINDLRIHVAGEKSNLIKQAHMHEANIIQTTDAVPSFIRGGIMGVFLSLVLCTAYYFMLPHNTRFEPLILAGLFIFGILLGGWGSSLMGVSVKNPIIEKYRDEIKNGQYVIIIDTKTEIEDIQIIKVMNNYPDVHRLIQPM